MAFYLVTGGAGFIGSHLVEELLRREHQVRVVDNLSTGKHENLATAVGASVVARMEHARMDSTVGVGAIGERVDFIEGDLADLDVAHAAVKDVDYVLHQAAQPSVPRSVDDPLRAHRANVEATVNLLVAARDANVRRLVFAGSSSVYGDQAELPKHEAMPTKPQSPYALQKLIGEQYLQLFSTLYGLETVTTRYFNVFGPRQDPSSPYSGVISLFIRAVLENRTPTIHGDGGQTRDFTYVANVVDGVLRAAEAPGISGEVINVATHARISLNELLAGVKQIVGSTIAPTYGPTRAGDVRDSQADIRKAERLLGYRPLVDFDEGLRRTVDWARGRD